MEVRVGWGSSNRKVRTKRESRKKDECNGKQNLESRRQVVFSPTFHLRKRRRKSAVDVGTCPYNLRPATALPSEDSGVILSDSEDEGFDKGPEARRQKYAIMAVNAYNNHCSSNFELVETGPLAAGYISTSRIFHFNFKAKAKDNPDAPVHTFFSEITKDNRSVVTCHRFILLGPTHLLPEKADTLGCLYCCSHNIHHPPFDESFRRGAEHLYPTLCSQLKEFRTYIAEGLKKAEKEEALFSPKFSHPGVKYLPNMSAKDIAIEDVALHFFNKKEGTNFELVKKGPIASSRISIGLIRHLNFEAKDKTDPDIPVQTFFAQVIRNRFFYFANFCKCLGPSNSLPDKADICGCFYCANTHVHHPPGSGYLTGRECLT